MKELCEQSTGKLLQKMKIGILVTPFVSEEVWKIETIPIDNRRMWLHDVPKQYRVMVDKKEHVSDDIAIAYCLKSKVQTMGYDVDIINPIEPDAYERVAKTNVTFLIIYDMLEAFHTLPEELYEKVKRLLQLPNVYPSKEYQKFVNHKDIYYSYFRQKGIPVLPNIYISDKEYDANPEAAVQKIMGLEKGDLGKIIGKPVLGQESIDFQEFNPPFSKERFQRYLERIFTNYNGVIFQPFIQALKNNTEYKLMYFGDKLSYIIEMNKQGGIEIAHPPETASMKDVVQFANNVFLNLPQITFREKEISRLITRVDVGCCYGPNKYFVSEVEFVPSLFAPTVEMHLPNKLVDLEITEQMLKILTQVKDIKIPTPSTTVKPNTPACTDFMFLLSLLGVVVFLYIVLTTIYMLRKRR